MGFKCLGCVLKVKILGLPWKPQGKCVLRRGKLKDFLGNPREMVCFEGENNRIALETPGKMCALKGKMKGFPGKS